MEQRQTNYDFLRIISAIAVVAIHVNASFLQANIENGGGGDIP